MRRRSGKGTAKARRRNQTRSSRRKRPDNKELVVQLIRERDEALEQLAATSEVLKVISNSPGELEPVFQAMLENAMRICEAKFGILYEFAAGQFRALFCEDVPPAYADFVKQPRTWTPGNGLGQAVLTKQVVHIRDVLEEPGYAAGDPLRVATVDLARVRTALIVPMLKEGELIGAFVIYRQEVRPFIDKQIELVQSFAAQAVIAIENARLLNELRQRTDDLSESLEQQTATSEVLRVISSSPTNAQPVFDAIAESAVRLCDGQFSFVVRFDGKIMDFASCYGLSDDGLKAFRSLLPMPATEGTASGRATLRRAVVEIPDVQTDPAYGTQGLAKTVTYRSIVAVPLLHEGTPIGSIAVARANTGSFPNRQIELLKTFAEQAVIAIENVRLFNETKEALEQQTATAEVLKVIAGSSGELTPVFDAMLENAVHICGAKFGNLFLYADNSFRIAAQKNAPPTYAERWRKRPVLMVGDNPHNPLDRLAANKTVINIPDLMAEPGYTKRDPRFVALVEAAGARTHLAVPMLKDNVLVGAISIFRQEVCPFTSKQIELVQNFAAQAVIAIENTRLLTELRESLQQQIATADVLKVISRSTFDLENVLNTLTASATRVCQAEKGAIFQKDGDIYRLRAHFGFSREEEQQARQHAREHPLGPGRGSIVGRVALTGRAAHINDVLADPEYQANVYQKSFGFRTNLGVPLLREGTVIGVFGLMRTEVNSFSEKEINLVTTFADQAVIAIENARLLNELRESLQQQTATADVLKVISRSTFDLGTVLQTLVESAARLCDADKTNISRQKDGVFFRAESYGFSPEFMGYVRNIPIQPDRSSGFGRALLERRAVHIPDVNADPEYTLVEAQRLGDYRTVLAVPMLREGVAIGVLSLTRSEVRPFSEKQIELATTFADQAAIAIENVRLFESVEARTREVAKSLDDLRTTQDRLVQTQKLALLGQLTAGIAHEIKNPLNFVNNFSGVSAEMIDELREALEDVSLTEKKRSEITELMDTLRGNFDKVVQHGKRADAIVKNMLQHSREGSGEHRVIDVNALVEESLNLAWHGARAETQGFEIKLKQSFDPSAGEADIFPQDIRRALLNVISNGFYAAARRRAETDGSDYEPTLTASTRNLGDRVEIRIRDNGTGMAPDVKEKMFNPFFTTKPTGEGTGLGLSISHDIIVKQHGGSIEVDTQPGEFTEMRVILPRSLIAL